jgi:diguanylate cyclase (GGDEF)-like protein
MTPLRKMAVASLLGVGFSVALFAILLFYGLFYTTTKDLKKLSEELYLHPFTVNGAAAGLKTSLYQMRSEALMLVLMQLRSGDWKKSSLQIDAFEQTAYQNLDVIKANFLGDMHRVERLEKGLREWHDIRAGILSDVKDGRFESADRRVKEEGSPKFSEILLEVDYVLAYSQRKAAQFVEEANTTSDNVLHQGQVLAIALFFTVFVTAVVVVWRVRFLHQELTRHASLDPLTGIHNRRNFLSLVHDENYRSMRWAHPYSLAVVDLDYFKKVNDTYGHHAGDAVLQHFCATCLAGLRSSDALGRLGGEEFGVLMPNTSSADALAVIERIRQAIAASSVQVGSAEIGITGSFGLVTSSASSSDDAIDALFRAADIALYAAKEQGRNRVVVHAS